MGNEQFRIANNCDTSGVYAIVNLQKKKVYIGSSMDVHKRLIGHKSKLKNGTHVCVEMQQDFSSGDEFIAYIVTEVRIRNESWAKNADLLYFEKEAIKMFKADNPLNGYNKSTNKYCNLRELENIKYAKSDLDYFFNMFDDSFPVSTNGREEDKKKFLSKVLKTN